MKYYCPLCRVSYPVIHVHTQDEWKEFEKLTWLDKLPNESDRYAFYFVWKIIAFLKAWKTFNWSRVGFLSGLLYWRE